MEMEKIKKTPKRQTLSGLVGQEPCVSASSPVARTKSPAAALPCPGPDFNTSSTSTPCGPDRADRRGLPETEVRLECADIEEKAGSGHRRKIRTPSSQKKPERDLCLQRGSPALPSRTLDQLFLEKQVESAFGLPACSGKRKTRSLGRPGLHPTTSRAKCQASPAQSKPQGDPGVRGLKPVPGQEPPVRPEKRKVSRQKARGWGEEEEQAGKKARSLLLSTGRAPSAAALVQPLPQPPQVTCPDRLEAKQSSGNEEARQDSLTAHLGREAQQPKKWKKKHLVPGVGEKSGPQPSLQEPPSLKKLVRAVKTEAQGLDSAPHSLHAPCPKSMPDVRQFFTVDLRNACRVICTLCHATIRQGKTEGRFRGSGLIRHLASKHGLDWERRPGPGSTGEGVGGQEWAQPKVLSTGAASFASGASPVPGGCPDTVPSGGSSREPALPTSLVAVEDSWAGTDAPSQPPTQAWNHSITELLCSLALPLSFVSSQPFRRFMAKVDPRYRLPSPAFFSTKALPLLHEAVGEQVLQEMQWAAGGRVHLTASISAQHPLMNFVAIAAHWVSAQSGSQPTAPSGSLRKRAVLWVRGLPLERAAEDRQPELLEQISLWLGRGSLRAGFLVSGGCPSLELATKDEGYTHIPCFIHCLDALVSNFLCHHHSIQIILGTARAICSHFQGSAEARSLLSQLQHQCGLPAQQPSEELSGHWGSAYRWLEWLVEQQQAVQAYAEKQQPGKASTALSAMFWSLADSLVKLLQPFQMVIRETSTPQASLSQVLPQLRYLHIFLEQVHRHFQEQSVGEGSVALRLAEGLALQLSTDRQLNELFYREEFVLATLLDPRFKGKVEAILPVGTDIDHWKQVLVYKVKEIMVSEYFMPTSGAMQSPRGMCMGTTRIARTPRTQGKGQKESLQRDSTPGSFLLVQRQKSLLEQLESVGLLVSKRSGASLSTENHLANVIVKKYLRENETIGAREDPLTYWERKREAWPALAQLATIYLSCPPTGAFSEDVLSSLNSPTITEQNPPLTVEAIEHLLFLKTNLESFPHYTLPPLIYSSSDPAEQEQAP